MKKKLYILWIACVMLSFMTIAASAAGIGYITVVNIDAPVAGAAPDFTGNCAYADNHNKENNSLKVEQLQWDGTFSADNTFIAGNDYTVMVTISFKDGVDNYFSDMMLGYEGSYNDRTTINGSAAKVVSAARDRVELHYTYSSVAEPTAADHSKAGIERGYYTWDEAEALRTSGRDGKFIGTKLEDLGKLTDVEKRSLTTVVFQEHDVEGAMQMIAEVTSNANTHFVNNVWFGADYTPDEIIEIMNERNTTWTQRFGVSGRMYSYDSRVYISESVYGGFTHDDTFGLGVSCKGVRLYKGNDVIAAVERGKEDTYNWCTNHVFKVDFDYPDATVYSYNDCDSVALFYRTCIYCGECEYDVNHLNEWVSRSGVGNSSTHPHHDDGAILMNDNAYIGVDANGQHCYWASCNLCGKNHRQTLLEDYRLSYLDSPNVWAAEGMSLEMFLTEMDKGFDFSATSALQGKEIAHIFTVDKRSSAKTSAWAQSEVNHALNNDLIDESLMGGDYTVSMTRLQFCSVAVKLAEKMLGRELPLADANTFSDSQNAYVLKAYAAGITTGTGNGVFSPDAPLDRQQMATFLYRTLQYVKQNSDIRYTYYDSKLANYTDSWQIADWAADSLAFMNALGLVKGMSETTISPLTHCTIEQAIAVANRSLKADKIGWYIVRDDKTLRGEWFFFCRFATKTGASTTYNYVKGNMFWMHDWMDTNEIGGSLVTYEPFLGMEVSANGDNFIPVREP